MGRRNGDVLVDALRDDCLLELSGGIKLEEGTGRQGKGHALVVGLEVEVDLGENKGGELAFGELLIFVEGLAGNRNQRQFHVRESAALGTYIWLNAPATSVQTVSISSFKVLSAKIFSSGSSSARKARTPVAVTRPGIVDDGDGPRR